MTDAPSQWAKGFRDKKGRAKEQFNNNLQNEGINISENFQKMTEESNLLKAYKWTMYTTLLLQQYTTPSIDI